MSPGRTGSTPPPTPRDVPGQGAAAAAGRVQAACGGERLVTPGPPPRALPSPRSPAWHRPPGMPHPQETPPGFPPGNRLPSWTPARPPPSPVQGRGRGEKAEAGGDEGSGTRSGGTAPRGHPGCWPVVFFFLIIINLFIYLFLAALGLRCYARVSSSCGEWGLLFVAVRGLLTVVASLCCGARALGAQASVVVARGLGSCGLQALEHRLSSCGARA